VALHSGPLVETITGNVSYVVPTVHCDHTLVTRFPDDGYGKDLSLIAQNMERLLKFNLIKKLIEKRVIVKKSDRIQLAREIIAKIKREMHTQTQNFAGKIEKAAGE